MLPYQKFFYTRKVLFLIYIWSIPAAIIRIYYINLVDIISVLLPVLQHRFSATKFDLITIDKSIRDRMNTVNCADPCDLFIYIYTHVCIYIYIYIYIYLVWWPKRGKGGALINYQRATSARGPIGTKNSSSVDSIIFFWWLVFFFFLSFSSFVIYPT